MLAGVLPERRRRGDGRPTPPFIPPALKTETLVAVSTQAALYAK